ncbi:Hsp20 family protein, partial [Catenibacterium mitsuokai]
TGSCSRKFYVGEGYKEEDFTAKFENGELMITFPKTEPEKIEEKKPIMIE